ncbi:hypothetical protein, partial [Mycobacterium kansasii]
DDWPLLRWRMRQYRHGRWGIHIVKANPQLADDDVSARPVRHHPDSDLPAGASAAPARAGAVGG